MASRRHSWGTAAAVTLALVAAAAVAAAFAHAAPADELWSAGWTAAAAAACLSCAIAWGAAPASNRRRWGWWTAGSACWLAGQLGWDAYVASGATPPSPGFADVGWWAFAICVVVGLVDTREGSRTLRAVMLIEALPIIGAALALSSGLLWADAAASALPAPARASALMYPALYVAAAVLTLQAMVRGTLGGEHPWGIRLVLGGMIGQAFAFILWSEQLLDGRYVAGATIIDPLWLVGLLSIAAGALTCARPGGTVAKRAEPGEATAVLPAAAFVCLVAALVHAELTHAPLPALIALTCGLLIAGATLFARGVLLQTRLTRLLERERAARALLGEREAALERINERLVEDSRRDALTGLLNRRALAEQLRQLDEGRRAGDQRYAVALCDVDRFKAFNDRQGHLAGDEALVRIARRLREVLREGDAAYRYGGEELLLLLPGADAAEAEAIAERARTAVSGLRIPHPEGVGGVLTLSFGLAVGADGPANEVLDQADAALYAAKRGGRDRVAFADSSVLAEAGARRPSGVEDPVVGPLRSLIAIARRGVEGESPARLLEHVGELVRSHLHYGALAMNLREGEVLRVVAVAGDDAARDALLHTTEPLREWEALLASRHLRRGAAWIPAGTAKDGTISVWTDQTTMQLAPDAWHPEDMLLAPMRGFGGELLGVISVDAPQSGRRPDDEEIATLMAVADYAGLLLARANEAPARPGARDQQPMLDAVMLLAETLDLRDAGTAAHSRTVGRYVRDTAAALGFPPDDVEVLHAAGVLHDLGKLAVPDAILHKPDRLTDAEWAEIRRHPEVGARILENAGLHRIAGWVRAHHERVDGGGYPNGLNADQIPLEARILAVADAYEAMVADRPYRAGMEPEEAGAELLRCAGTQFDEAVVDAFLRVLALDSGRLVRRADRLGLR